MKLVNARRAIRERARGTALCAAAMLAIATPASATGSHPILNAQLERAVRAQDVPEMRRLVAEGADINARVNGEPLIQTAALQVVSGNGDAALRFLISQHANLDVVHRDSSPLKAAAEFCHTSLAKILLDAGADPEFSDPALSTRFTAIDQSRMRAAESGASEACKDVREMLENASPERALKAAVAQVNRNLPKMNPGSGGRFGGVLHFVNDAKAKLSAGVHSAVMMITGDSDSHASDASEL